MKNQAWEKKTGEKPSLFSILGNLGLLAEFQFTSQKKTGQHGCQGPRTELPNVASLHTWKNSIKVMWKPIRGRLVSPAISLIYHPPQEDATTPPEN